MGEDFKKTKKRGIPHVVVVIGIFVALIIAMEVFARMMGNVTADDPSQLTNAERMRTIVLILGVGGLMLAFIFGGLIFIFYNARREYRKIERIADESGEVLNQHLPATAPPVLPPMSANYAPVPSGGDGGVWAMSVVAAVAGVLLLFVIVPFFWLVTGSFYGPIIVILVYVQHWPTLKQYGQEHGQGSAPLFAERYWDVVGSLVLSGLEISAVFLVYILVAGVIDRFINNYLVSWIIALVVMQYPLGLVIKWRIRLYLAWMYRPLRNLDYDKAQGQAVRMPGLFASMRVYVTMCQGRIDEAESQLHALLQKARENPDKKKRHEVLYLEKLAYVRFAQERYGEVEPILAHIRQSLTPKDPDALTLSAMAYLHHDVELSRALEMSKWAVQILRRRHWLVRIGDYYTLPEVLAVYAWALAKNGQVDPAKKLARQALDDSKDYLPMSRAHVLLNLGHTLLVLGNAKSARRLYAQAAQLVPEGLVGDQARRALKPPVESVIRPLEPLPPAQPVRPAPPVQPVGATGAMEDSVIRPLSMD